MSKKIVLSAGELSGDRHAANVAKELLKKDPTLKIIGIGSDFSRKAGVDVRFDITDLSSVGLFESFRYLPKLLSYFYQILAMLKQEKPDVFVAIDNQGFHMKLLKKIKKMGIPTLYYISPQEWHWGTVKGGKKVVNVVDKICAIFPKEASFYKKLGADVSFVGNPSVDTIRTFKQNHADIVPDTHPKICAIFPGSRTQEIERLCPVFIKAASIFCDKYGFKPVLSISSPHYKSLIERLVKQSDLPSIELFSGNSLELMKRATTSLTSSGTIGLEHALMGVPFVVAYKLNPITYWVGKTFLKQLIEKIPFISLPNILMNQMIFPELIQDKASSRLCVEALEKVTFKDNEKIKKVCHQLSEQLGEKNVAQEVGRHILALLNSKDT